MFKYYSIKKYGVKLRPALVRRYGEKAHYSASQVRTTVYKSNFNPKYLPLAYLLCLEKNALQNVMHIEYPELVVNQYKQEIVDYLVRKQYSGYLQILA